MKGQKLFIDEKGRECIGIDGIACKYKLWKEFNKDKQREEKKIVG